ncbi:hypothetical protein AYJ66_17270 [Dietzia cinnamea]|nr:hypothetical protein AYJ66_17270 [Dietzia cinnamea]
MPFFSGKLRWFNFMPIEQIGYLDIPWQFSVVFHVSLIIKLSFRCMNLDCLAVLINSGKVGQVLDAAIITIIENFSCLCYLQCIDNINVIEFSIGF